MSTPATKSSTQTIDFAKPFTFTFEDPDWLKKILIGGLFYLAAFLIVGIFFVGGYAVRMARNVIGGAARPLPEWDDLGGMLVDGVKVFLVALVYAIPIILAWLLAFGGMFAAGTLAEEHAAAEPLALLFGCMVPVFFVLVIVYSVFLPAVLLMYVATGSIGASLNVRNAFRFVVNNPLNYILAYVINMIANFLGQMGIILLCIGVLFTSFWALLVSTYAFADAYRLARVR